MKVFSLLPIGEFKNLICVCGCFLHYILYWLMVRISFMKLFPNINEKSIRLIQAWKAVIAELVK